jgi:hypothetical protein
MMGDILYLQQALRQPDAKEFMQAVIKEVNGHVDCNNWTLKKRSKVPEDVYVGYHTRKIKLPVMPLTVPVTLSIPVMSAARTSTVRPFILRFF